MKGKLVASGWLRRVIELEMAGGPVRVEYNGRGFGHESVLVDDQPAVKSESVLWFVPRFSFQADGKPAQVEVRVWPWWTLRCLELLLDGEVVYQEPTDWRELMAALGVLLFLIFAGLFISASDRQSTAGDRLPLVEAPRQ